MPKDELRRLSPHVVAPLLRALMSIPRRPESRLYLRKVAERTVLTRSEHHYNVFRWRMIGDHRVDENVGTIWVDSKPAETIDEKLMPWCWEISTREGAAFATTWAKGRARTREESMDAFRNAWDRVQPTKRDEGARDGRAL